MTKIAIVEDEQDSAECLQACLQRYQEETGTEWELTRFHTADAFLSAYQHDFDIVFMDISMPGTSGMEASHKLRELDENVVLIFVTSLAQYAIEGYEVRALDFVLKPVNYYSFKLKIKKALEAIRHRNISQLMLTTANGTEYLKVADILYIEVQAHDIIYHTLKGDVRNTGTLKTVETQLEHANFFRCNYCYLVNLSHVTSVTGNTVFVDGLELQISRNRKKAFLQQLSQFYGKGGG